MSGVFITAGEIDALHGAGPLATTLYLYLRSWMDLRTGEVGVRRVISLDMLAAYAETHTGKNCGEQVEQPSRQNVRTALERLKRRGLLSRRRTEGLVFALPMARTGQVRPKNTQHTPNTDLSTEPNTAELCESRAVAGVCSSDEAIPNTPKATPKEQYPTHIRDKGKPYTYQSSSLPLPKARARRQDDDEKAMSAESDEATPPVHQSARVNAIAALLRMQGVAVGYDSAVLVRWVDARVSDEEIAAAVGRARKARLDAGSEQPIGIRYLDKVLASVRGDAARSRSGAAEWRASEQAMVAKGRELGIAPWPGESWSAFARRIEARVLEHDRKRLNGGVA